MLGNKLWPKHRNKLSTFTFVGVVATLDVGVVDVNMRFPETDRRGRASIKVLGVNDSTNNLV